MEGSNAPGNKRKQDVSGGLQKQISFFGLTMIAAGACIGSGIFIAPADVASHLQNDSAILFIWLLGGLVALTGSLTFAELAARFPDAGGVYVYLRESFGRVSAFLYGWCILTVITSGAIAGLALIFARYLNVLIPLSQAGQLIVSISVILAVTFINVLGVKYGEVFSSIFTLFKLIGIASIIIIGVVLGSSLPETAEAVTSVHRPGIGAYALAMIGVLWSYGGWHHASYVAGETRSASKIVPKAMVAGAMIVTAAYVLVNYAYLRLLPIEVMSTSPAVASDALTAAVPFGGKIIAVLIALSTFGTISIFTLTAPRIYYSMAADGSFLRVLSKVHPRHHTPVWAICIQSSWAIFLLLFWSTFENLMTYVVFMDWVFMTLAACAIFLFRNRSGIGEQTGFRTPLYPIIPLIFIGISLWFVAYTLIGKPQQTWAGIILLVAGLPVYYLSRKKLNASR